MWTFDNTAITYDQTCWTWDGSNSCFANAGGGGQYRGVHSLDDDLYDQIIANKLRQERIRDEDDLIIKLVTMMLTKGML